MASSCILCILWKRFTYARNKLLPRRKNYSKRISRFMKHLLSLFLSSSAKFISVLYRPLVIDFFEDARQRGNNISCWSRGIATSRQSNCRQSLCRDTVYAIWRRRLVVTSYSSALHELDRVIRDSLSIIDNKCFTLLALALLPNPSQVSYSV